MKFCFTILLFFLSFTSTLKAQDEPRLVQFSGLVLTADSSLPLPYAHIKVKHSFRGTISNFEGFFSIVVRETDTIEVSAVGYKKRRYIIPPNIEDQRYSILVALITDTLTMNEAMIYPWPSKDRFKQAFLELEVNKTYYDLAFENLHPDKMKRLFYGTAMDASENQHYYMNQIAGRAGYLGGQTNYAQFPGMGSPIPLSLLNPFAWAEFIKALKEGRFKRQDYHPR